MAGRAATCVALLFVCAAAAVSHPGDVRERAFWVFFSADASASAAPPALSADALAARRAAGLEILPNDRPIPATLLDRVRATGARIRFTSRWLRAVSVDADTRARRRLARLPGVIAVRPVGRLERAAAVSTPRPVRAAGGDAPPAQQQDSAYYGPNWHALRVLGVPRTHAFGFTGVGIRIAILDTGFEPRHDAFTGVQVFATRDFIGGDAIVYTEPQDPPGVDQETHGTQVWSLVGGRRPGFVVGPAHGAQFLLARVDAEPGDTEADEDRWVAALEWAESMGARIVLSAVVFRFDFTDKPAYPLAVLDGNTTVTTSVADEAARRGVLVVVAVGNDGPAAGTLSAPADADSVLSVGAVDALGGPAVFNARATARGPTADGRRKPEVSARAVQLQAASNVAFSSYTAGLAGTSYAAALVAGAAGAFLQAWPSLSPFAVRRALTLSGTHATNPDNAVGAGIPDLASAILFPDGLATTGVSDLDLQRVSTSVAPTFSWSAALVHPNLRPVVYRVEIATDPVFDSIVQVDSVQEAFSLALRAPLRAAQSLWWRVVARGPLNIMRVSNVATPFVMPRWVRLVSPSPAQVTFVNDPRPELRWTPLQAPPPVGPFTYDLEILSADDGRLVQPAQRNLSESQVRPAQPLVPNVAYRWRVIARTRTGAVDTVESSAAFVVTSDTRPPATLLYDNFPNPFPRNTGEAETRIWFDIAERTTVELGVFDQRGRLVRRLVPATADCGSVTLDPGQYGRATGGQSDPCVNTRWDGTDEQGRRVAAGLYILRLRASGSDQFRHMVFIPRIP
jgi:hypothetical protein